jgi:hypothetical protein
MQLFYTGAASFQAPQYDPFQSLGGYISNSPVPNNQLNNLFGDLSWQSVKQKKVCVRGLILQNTLGFDCIDVIFGYEYPSNMGASFKLEVAFVQLNQQNPTQIERIPNGEASPIFATFEEANIDPANNIDNSIDIGSLANNAAIAVWLRLTPLGGLVTPNFPNVDSQLAWWKTISDPEYTTLETIQFKIKYTYNQ